MRFRKSDVTHAILAALAWLFIFPMNPILGGLLSGTTLGIAREARELRQGEMWDGLKETTRDVLPWAVGGLVMGGLIKLAVTLFT